MRVQWQALCGPCLAIPLAILTASPTRAETSATGTWRAGTTAIDVTIESWGTDCGPRPQSTRSSGNTLVNIEQKDRILILHGRDQDVRSDTCWSRNPAIKRSVASYASGIWTTRCQTADNDPRAEQGAYTLKLVDPNTLLYQDVSHYDWALNTSRCVATFTTTQTLSRSDAKANTKSAKPPVPQRVAPPEVPAPPEVERTCKPGAPVHLNVRPRRIDVEVGQRVCFRARITDAADCALRNLEVNWSLSHSKALRATLNGNCFTSADSVAEAQGEFRIIAKAAGLEAEAIASVRPIDLSAVIAKRMEGSGLIGFDESAESVRSAPKAVARISTHTSTEAQGGSTSRLLIIGLGALAVLVAGAGFWYSRRARPAAISGRGSRRGSGSLITEAGEESGASRPAAASNLPSARSGSPAEPAEGAEQWICPTCRVGYPAHQGTCPKDGTVLMPYAQFAQRRRPDQERAKRCPLCGKTFGADTAFCSNDGASLVDS